KNATLNFQVEKNWTETNSLDKNNIALFKFFPDENRWTELNTTYDSSDRNYYYYSTELTGFSYFVIGEKEQASEQNKIIIPSDTFFLVLSAIILRGIIVLIILIIKKVR
ncbi:MAG: PGF-pre-PGF domain-containing protein, partial [Candidatus Pacearchaeota archaeon]|nr:PGF-pre-PGF domain-containing protein [Candidatus Pacearchaeota archaeon]